MEDKKNPKKTLMDKILRRKPKTEESKAELSKPKDSVGGNSTTGKVKRRQMGYNTFVNLPSMNLIKFNSA